MIATRTPFRISFAGGGTDLRCFYAEQPGYVVSTAVNKYMYILIHPYFDDRIQVKYSRTELVNSVAQIQHPIVRVALGQFGVQGVDINSIADVPAGTGLGSSSAFTVGILNALYAYTGRFTSKELLARKACEIEIEILKDPIGKQDQYAAAFGGLNAIIFRPDETVEVQPIVMPRGQRARLADNLLAFYLGGSRAARDVLGDQEINVRRDPAKFNHLVRMADLARQLHESLTRGNLDDMGKIMDEGWQLKKSLSSQISEDWIDACYRTALDSGATGGKVLGAGGGGFLLLYCEKEHQEKLTRSLHHLRPVKLGLESVGSTVIFYEGDAAT